MNNIDYNKIINISENFDIKYEYSDRDVHSSIRMVGTNYPNSITEEEFFIIKNTIMSKNLKVGLEIGTGFGISTLASGLGFKQTGGKIVTIDGYIEEQYQDPYSESEINFEKSSESLGHKSTKNLINYFDLEDCIYAKIGLSPQDVEKNIDIVHGKNSKLDYVFIDGLHTDEAVEKDFNSIKNKLNDKFVLFFHDSDFVPETIKKIENEMNIKTKMLTGPRPVGFCLSIMTNYTD
jgi:hypothetical protein